MARVTLQEYCDQARALIDGRQYAEAIAICRHILKRYPRHIRTYQVLGEACLENGELAEAKDIFKRLLENADPENLTAYAGLGVAYQEEGQLAEAIWYMERAFELAPNNEETRNTLRQLYYQRDGVEPGRIRHSKAALARLYARGGQYRQAIEEFRRLLGSEENHDRMDLKVSLAETLWRDGRREQAAELAREILQAAPECLKATLLLGEISIEKGRHEEGNAILEKTRSLDPEHRAAQALFGETSPLPPQVVLIPKVEPFAEPPLEPPAPTEVAVEPAVEAIAAEAETAAQGTTEAAVESAPAAVAPPTEAIAPEAEITAEGTTQVTEAPAAISEEAEAAPGAGLPPAQAPAVSAEPVPTVIAEETEPAPVAEEPAAVVQESAAEEVAPNAAELRVLLVEGETAVVAVPEQVEEEAPAVAAEENAPPTAAEVAAPTEAQDSEISATVTEPEAAPKKKRGKRAAPQAAVLEAGTAAAAGPLSDIERYQLLLEQKPKDDELRLALARAYRDGSQMKSALEQYAKLVRAKQKLLPDIIADVEGIVASRPDNFEGHELLADLYGKNGQLQKALERYRWVLERLREGDKGN